MAGDHKQLMTEVLLRTADYAYENDLDFMLIATCKCGRCDLDESHGASFVGTETKLTDLMFEVLQHNHGGHVMLWSFDLAHHRWELWEQYNGKWEGDRYLKLP